MLSKALQIAAGGNSIAGWPDISTATHVRFEQTTNTTSNKRGVFLKPDGTKLFALNSNDDLIQYSLSTAWDISSYTSADHTFQTDQTNNPIPQGLFFKDDGTEFYINQRASGVRGVCQYSLTTAWDISTASYTRKFETTLETNPYATVFSPDGLNMYVLGGQQKVFRYTLTTAWDISTASHTSSSSAITIGSEYLTYGLFLKPEGDRIFVLGQFTDKIYQWNLSTLYDSTGIDSTPDSEFSVATQEADPESIFISPDGAHLYVGGFDGDGIDQYSLG